MTAMTAGGDALAGSLPGLRTRGSGKTPKAGRRTRRHGSAGARPAGYPLGQFDPGRGGFWCRGVAAPPHAVRRGGGAGAGGFLS